MPGEHKRGDVVRKVKKLCDSSRWSANGYLIAYRRVGGRLEHYPIPFEKGRRVKDKHIRLMRHRLNISEEDWDSA